MNKRIYILHSRFALSRRSGRPLEPLAKIRTSFPARSSVVVFPSFC